jgi:N-acetylmuramoyl-L-alanine amidase
MLNASVTRLTRGGEWEKVKTSTGTTGFAFASFLTTSKATAVTGNGKVVVLDPGHGGHDSGAVGVDGTYEKTVNYNFAVATKAALEAKGYKVYMTRSGDVDCKVPVIDTNAELSCRSKVSSTYKANIFISIHANSEYTGSANGTETYYNANSNYDGHMNASPSKSKLLSDTVHKYIQPAFGSLNRGSKDSSYYVLRFNSVPAILIEVGFMSNTGDLSKMKNASMQQTFANAITKGVDEYFTKGG